MLPKVREGCGREQRGAKGGIGERPLARTLVGNSNPPPPSFTLAVTNHSAPAPLAFPLPSNSPTKTIAYGDGTAEAYEPYKTCQEDYGKFVTPKPREPFKPPKSSL